MNITTLQKCVDELKKETPNISYVLGMLETVIEMNGAPVYPFVVPSGPQPTYTTTSATALGGSGLVSDLPEGGMDMDAYARGPVGKI